MINKKKYFVTLIVMLLVFAVAGILILRENYSIWFFVTLDFFGLLGIAFYYLIRKANTGSDHQFLNFFLISVILKLFASFAFVVLYLIFVKENNIAFVLNFFIQYIAFTVFESSMFMEASKTKTSEK